MMSAATQDMKTKASEEQLIKDEEVEPSSKRQKTSEAVPVVEQVSQEVLPAPVSFQAAEKTAGKKKKPPFVRTKDLSKILKDKANFFGNRWSQGPAKGANIRPMNKIFVVLESDPKKSMRIPPWPLNHNPQSGQLSFNLPVSEEDAENLKNFQMQILEKIREEAPELLPPGNNGTGASSMHKLVKDPLPDTKFSALVNLKFDNQEVNQDVSGKNVKAAFTMVDSEGNKVDKTIDIESAVPGSNFNFAIVWIKHVVLVQGKLSITLRLKAIQLVDKEEKEVDFFDIGLDDLVDV